MVCAVIAAMRKDALNHHHGHTNSTHIAAAAALVQKSFLISNRRLTVHVVLRDIICNNRRLCMGF